MIDPRRSARASAELLARGPAHQVARATTRRPGRCSRPTACTSTPALRDEVVARVDRLNLPSYTGFVMPTLTPAHGPGGEITDVRIGNECDFAGQMLKAT